MPGIIRDLDDRAMMEHALIENIQREDLNPLEEANGLQRLIDEFGIFTVSLAVREPVTAALQGRPVMAVANG